MSLIHRTVSLGFGYISAQRGVLQSSWIDNGFKNIKVASTYIPERCKEHINLALTTEKTKKPINKIYQRMKDIVGVEPFDATYEDFQRMFKCQNLYIRDCSDKGLRFPVKCSVSPCDTCTSRFIGKF